MITKAVLVTIVTAVSLKVGLAVSEPKSPCRSCVGGLSNIHSAVQDMKDDPEKLSQIQQNICSPHPKEGQRLCWEIVQRGTLGLGNKVSSPASTCAHLGICEKKEAVELTTQEDDSNCPLCEYLVSFLKQQMGDPATEAEIIEEANKVCQDLEGSARATCKQYVAEYSSQLFAWVHSADPEEICTTAGMCDSSLRLPELSPQLAEKARRVLSAGDDDQCNTCQLVVVEASSSLSDPDTQKQILDYVKKSCKDFQSFKDQCESYVELYGPMVLQMAKQYLTPELCAKLGFCPSPVSLT